MSLAQLFHIQQWSHPCVFKICSHAFIYTCDHILSYTDVITLITHNIEDSRRSYTAVVIPCYAQHYNN